MPNIPLHGDDDEPAGPAPPKRSHKRKTTSTPRRRSERAPRASLETRIRESLEAVADWLRDRGDAELGGVLHEDAQKMASVLGRLAKLNPLASKAVSVIADALEPVRAFGPTLRVLWRRLVDRRARTLAEREQEPPAEEMLTQTLARGQGGDGGGEPEPQVAEPWRIR